MLSKWVAECCIEFVGTRVILFPAWQRGSWSASSDPWICHGWCFPTKIDSPQPQKLPQLFRKGTSLSASMFCNKSSWSCCADCIALWQKTPVQDVQKQNGL
jgi:hypothetical protein